MRGTHTHTCIYTSLQISITWYTQDAFKNIYIVNDNQNNNAKSSYFIVATGFNNMLKLKTFCTPQIISFLFLFFVFWVRNAMRSGLTTEPKACPKPLTTHSDLAFAWARVPIDGTYKTCHRPWGFHTGYLNCRN